MPADNLPYLGQSVWPENARGGAMPGSVAEFYVMRNTTSGGRGFDTLCYGVSNERGEFLDQALDNEIVHHAFALKHRRRPLGDWISTTGGWLALSERATQVFRQFRICDSVRWIPLTIHDRDKKLVTEATLLYGPKEWDVLDLVQSEYKYYESAPEVIHRVYKWVLRHDDVPPFDAFFARELKWIITARLHDAIIEAELTGFEFLAEGERYNDPVIPGFGF
jgi:hypothetical protein